MPPFGFSWASATRALRKSWPSVDQLMSCSGSESGVPCSTSPRASRSASSHLATSAFFFSGSFARIASPTKESSPSHGRTSFDVDRTLHDSPVPKKRTRTSPSSSFGARTLHGHHGKPISFAHTLSSRPKS